MPGRGIHGPIVRPWSDRRTGPAGRRRGAPARGGRRPGRARSCGPGAWGRPSAGARLHRPAAPSTLPEYLTYGRVLFIRRSSILPGSEIALPIAAACRAGPDRSPTMSRIAAALPLVLSACLLAACSGDEAPAQPPPPEVGVVEATATDLPLTR